MRAFRKVRWDRGRGPSWDRQAVRKVWTWSSQSEVKNPRPIVGGVSEYRSCYGGTTEGGGGRTNRRM